MSAILTLAGHHAALYEASHGDMGPIDEWADAALTMLAHGAIEWRPVMLVTVPGEPVGASRPRVVRGRPVTRAAAQSMSRAELIRRITNPVPPRVFMPEKHTTWEALAVSCAIAQMKVQGVLAHAPGGREQLTGPVRVSIVAIHPRPQRLRRRGDPRERLPAPTKPDGDNCLKLAMDAMTKAKVYKDDAQVVRYEGDAFYQAIGPHVRGGKAPDAEPARTVIAIYTTTHRS